MAIPVTVKTAWLLSDVREQKRAIAFVPVLAGIGALMGGVDIVRNRLPGMARSAASGDWRAFGGHALGAGLSAASAVPGFGLAGKGLGSAAKLLRGRGAVSGVRSMAANAAQRGQGALSRVHNAALSSRLYNNRFINPMHASVMAPAPAGTSAAGKVIHFGKTQLPFMATAIGVGGVADGLTLPRPATPAQAPSFPGIVQRVRDFVMRPDGWDNAYARGPS